MNLPVIVLGGGGHARVLMDILTLRGVRVIGFAAPAREKMNPFMQKLNWLGHDETVLGHLPSEIRLVNGIGTVKVSSKRREVFEFFKIKGYSFMTLIHPSAVVAADAELGEGAQVMAGAVIQPGASIGQNSIINTRASVDHDCIIGSHVHVAPGVTLSGAVTIGDGCHIGTGAVVVQGLTIMQDTFVKAGRLVSKHLLDKKIFAGKS